MRKGNLASSVGLITAFAASLCCITPLIALLAGASGAASTLTWLAPFRPYLIGMSVLALVFAWVQSFSTPKTAQCKAVGTCTAPKKSFLASRSFLLLITVATALVTAFTLYSKAFYPTSNLETMLVVEPSKMHKAVFTIKGMTCAGCEAHVNSELAKVNGMVESVTSYAKRNTVVRFDGTKTTIEQLQAAIAKTGYKVIATKLETNGNNK